MRGIYEYRTIRIKRASWPQLRDATFGALETTTREATGSIFAICAGVIGFAGDEGTLIRAWPDEVALARDTDRTLAAAPMIVQSSAERLAPTMRPVDDTPPRTLGIYAHRWFWLQPQDWEEFQRLSHDGIWPYFESDGCAIIGLWRSIEPGPLCKALLVTRYPNVAHWERTRLQSTEAPPGADAALYETGAGRGAPPC